MSKREAKLLIEDSLESAHKVLKYTEELTFDQLIQVSKTVDAVIRNFVIIGEAGNARQFAGRISFRSPLHFVTSDEQTFKS